MQGLILAAGLGSRLKPLTDLVPKALVEVNHTPLLLNAIECLYLKNVSEILIVVGSQKDKIMDRLGFDYKGTPIVYIDNPIYNQTNNVYSFWLASNYIKEDCVMLECDLFYNVTLLDTLLENTDVDCNILVSPYDDDIMDGTVLTFDQDYNVNQLILKRDQKVDGFSFDNKFKTVNAYYFSKDFMKNVFLPLLDTYVKTQNLNSYYELVIGAIIYFGYNKIKAVNIDATQWCEIDSVEDLKRAEVLFK